MQVLKTVSNLESRSNGDDFLWYRNLLQAPKSRSGGMPARKFSNLKALKPHFQHSQTNSCVKKVLKIDCYFLNFDKNIVVISCNIFS